MLVGSYLPQLPQLILPPDPDAPRAEGRVDLAGDGADHLNHGVAFRYGHHRKAVADRVN